MYLLYSGPLRCLQTVGAILGFGGLGVVGMAGDHISEIEFVLLSVSISILLLTPHKLTVLMFHVL
jgi:hypothetical protein